MNISSPVPQVHYNETWLYIKLYNLHRLRSIDERSFDAIRIGSNVSLPAEKATLPAQLRRLQLHNKIYLSLHYTTEDQPLGKFRPS